MQRNQASRITKTLQDCGDAEGDNCPDDVVTLLANYRSKDKLLQVSSTSAAFDLKLRQDRVSNIGSELLCLNKPIDKVAHQTRLFNEVVTKNEALEKSCGLLLRLVKLGPVEMAKSGLELTAKLGDLITKMEWRADALLGRRMHLGDCDSV
ncbi:hypothetical protein ACHAPU_011113 [Fusarium lateritium]